MKRKYTIEEIKEAINTAQLKVIENFDKKLEEFEREKGKKADDLTKMVMTMQNMMTVVTLENELIKELEGK